MFFIYRIIIGAFFYTLLPFLLLFVMVTGKNRQGLGQRFGFYPAFASGKTKDMTIWLHAASVGEVQAARPVVKELKKRYPATHIILTTMTLHGLRIAKSQLDETINCFLAPLDIPWVVARSVKQLNADVYICMETELWPLLLHALSLHGTRLCLVNGRLSEKSFSSYYKIRWFVKRVLVLFDRMAVISETDKQRYLLLGADPGAIAVEGNVKYDIEIPQNINEVVLQSKELLQLETCEVFIAGSTHTGEEELLLSLYQNIKNDSEIVFIIAPRHVERVEQLMILLQNLTIEYQLLSQLKSGEKRKASLLLVDTMGDLAYLYSVADFVFCGGSLVVKGGHNIIEAALWQKAVFYGPSIEDFRDGADLLESVKAGFPVKDVIELEDKMRYFRDHKEEYQKSCIRAGEVARLQQGSSSRQLEYVLRQGS